MKLEHLLSSASQELRSPCKERDGVVVVEEGEGGNHGQVVNTKRRRRRSAWEWVMDNLRSIKGVATKDSRRVVHASKVGLALSLVSLTVLIDDSLSHFGTHAVWAIMTVVVVFEYTVGGTLSKGLNRGIGTFLAACLAVLVDHFANMMPPNVEPYIVVSSIFVVGTLATFTRFFPSIKAKYDYGVLIFLLTFCLVVLSSYRVPQDLMLVLNRMITVIIGGVICLIISLFICPVWAGDDLHATLTTNFELLGNSLEECVKEYFEKVNKLERMSSKICKGEPHEDPIYKGYREVLVSKQTEESLATFASWEPRYMCLKCASPWKQYVKVGAILRYCAYTISALHGCVVSEIQAPESLRLVFLQPCMDIGTEVSKLLKELGSNLRRHQRSKNKDVLMEGVNMGVEKIHQAINSYSKLLSMQPSSHNASHHINLKPEMILVNQTRNSTSNESMRKDICQHKDQLSINMRNQKIPVKDILTESLSVATFVSLLVEIVARIDPLLDALFELENQARFKEGEF